MTANPNGLGDDLTAQPHDALVKWTFSQLEHAIGLLRAALPPELVAAVDFRTLRIEKETFVDSALKHLHGDLILAARMGEDDVYIYAVVEHQRKVETLMVFRVLHYMARLWHRLVLQEPKRATLPPIVPLLIHHSDTGWTAATASQDIIAGKGPARDSIEPHIPRFELRLIDLSEGGATRLMTETMTPLGDLVLKLISAAHNDDRLRREIPYMASALDEVLRSPDAYDALGALLRYIASTHPRMRKDEVATLLLSAVSPKTQEVIVTFLDEIELDGKRKGRLEGERHGRERVLLELLAAKFGKLAAGVKTRIEEADDATLASWTVRVLTEPTLERVFAQGAAPPPAKRRAPARKRSRPA